MVIKPFLLHGLAAYLDGGCDQQLSDDHPKFMTLTEVDSTWDDQPFQRYGCCPPKFEWFTWLHYAPFVDALPSVGYVSLATVHLPTKFEVSIIIIIIIIIIINVDVRVALSHTKSCRAT